MNLWSCDFETTTDKNDCRIWLWAGYRLEDDKFVWGIDFKSFIDFTVGDLKSKTLYFHNLAFDGEFIIHNLFDMGLKYYDAEHNILPNNTFKTLISDTGIFYSMEFKYRNVRIKIFDSLKILKSKVAVLPKTFGLEVSKGDIDYNKYRPKGYIPDDEEISYIYRDVKIVADSLKIMFKEGLNKITLPSSALSWYKDFMGKKYFESLFPQLSETEDSFIRRSYKGGFSWLNPKYKNKVIHGGKVFDVNSLYPYVMHEKLLPYGQPKYFSGRYVENKLYPLYVQGLWCKFKVKKNTIPTIQLKHNFRFSDTEYLTECLEDSVYLCLTSVDLKLFFDHYNVFDIEYVDGYMFKGTENLFKGYVDYWTEIKTQATLEGNAGMRTISKLMQNSLYGKFGTNPVGKNKIPTFIDGEVHYNRSEPTKRKALYIPVATFITSYARDITIRSAQTCYKNFIYADTDSLHIKGDDTPNINVHPTQLGAWKNEFIFSKGKYLRSKCYIELGHEPDKNEEDALKVTVAGMPSDCYSQVTFDNFTYGMKYYGKKRTQRVKGGIIISDTDFTIK